MIAIAIFLWLSFKLIKYSKLKFRGEGDVAVTPPENQPLQVIFSNTPLPEIDETEDIPSTERRKPKLKSRLMIGQTSF